MKVTTEELERCQVLMTVEIESKQEQDMLQKAAKRIARQIRIPGFRSGKAPFNVVVRRFGMEAIQQEALEQGADKMIQKALDEVKVEPFAQIALESIDWNPLTIKLKVPTEPKVELADYRSIRLDSEEVEVSEEDVRETLLRLQEQNAVWTPVDRPAELGDLVDMSVVERDGDTILAERESIEYELSEPEPEHEKEQDDESSENFVQPDLTTPLLGLSAGGEKTFDVDYPEAFQDERYAGKTITFTVKVSSVKVKEVDPLDGEFAKSVSEFETLAELEDDIRQNIRQQREDQRDFELGNEVLDKLVEESTIEWPLAFEEESIADEMQNYERRMQAYGLSMDNYLQMENKTSEDFKEEIRETVVQRLKRSLVISEIAEQENLDVSESEILNQAKLISDYSGRGEQVWRNILASEFQQKMIAHDLLTAKATHWLAAIAKGEDPSQPEPDGEEVEPTPDSEVDRAEASQVEGENTGKIEVASAEPAEPNEEPPAAEIDEVEAVESVDANDEIIDESTSSEGKN